MTAADPFSAAPIGSRWYAWGEHYEVVGHRELDGQPRVYLRNIRTGKKDPCAALLAGLIRKGVRQEAGRSATADPALRTPRVSAVTERKQQGSARPNRKEPEMARKTAGPKEQEARAQREAQAAVSEQNGQPDTPAAEDSPAAPVAEVKSDLYAALLAETKSISADVVIEEKAAYARVGLGSDRGKTLVYVNHPSKKGVRLEIPSKTAKGGYDVVKVATEKDIAKAMTKIGKRAEALAS